MSIRFTRLRPLKLELITHSDAQLIDGCQDQVIMF